MNAISKSIMSIFCQNHNPQFITTDSPTSFTLTPNCSTQISLEAHNTSNSLQNLLRILRPIVVFLLTIIILPIIKMIVNLPESSWSCRAMIIVIPT